MLSSDVSGQRYSAVSPPDAHLRDPADNRTKLLEKELTAGATGAEKLGELPEGALDVGQLIREPAARQSSSVGERGNRIRRTGPGGSCSTRFSSRYS
jgi:hypothetical protein